MATPPPSSSLELLSDEQLVACAVDGKRDAFNQLVVRHERRLFRFLSQSAPSAADVEDAMQQAMVKAYLNLRQYNPRWRFTTWLFTIALRELRSLRRRTGPATVAWEGHPEPAAPAARSSQEPGDLWASAKRLLNDKQYTALWLRYGEDLAARDIAKVMSRPRIWVSVTLHRACAALRQAAAEREENRPDRETKSVEKKKQTAGGVT